MRECRTSGPTKCCLFLQHVSDITLFLSCRFLAKPPSTSVQLDMSRTVNQRSSRPYLEFRRSDSRQSWSETLLSNSDTPTPRSTKARPLKIMRLGHPLHRGDLLMQIPSLIKASSTVFVVTCPSLIVPATIFLWLPC